MNSGSWKIEELRNLAEAKYGSGILPQLEEFISSLRWIQWKADYFSEQSKKIWENLFKKSVVRFGSKEFHEGLDSSVAEAEAMIQVLHSIGDILAQVVNLVVLGTNALPEHKVSLFKIIEELKNRNIAPDVYSAIIAFANSKEYRYFQAFCNTIKHRKLLDVEHKMHIDFTDKTKSEEGLRFREFQYKENTIPAEWIHSILTEYRVNIYSLMRVVGNAINNYLR